MTTDLTTIEESRFLPALTTDMAARRYNTLVEFVQTVMRPNVDYGVIPGTPKPTLLKPGAEKLTTLFGLTVRFQMVEHVADWIGEAYSGEPFFYYLYRCQLWRGDLLIAEADGSCNSRESKYRWREQKRTCPACGLATIIKGKEEYGGGWLCFKKTGGCGAKYSAGDPAIEGQQVGRIPNPDICDQVNTIQKMSQKRALIAATLIGVNASEFFTQDIEDIPMAGSGATYAPPVQVVDTTTGEILASPKQTNGERPLVKRLRELVADCRSAGVAVPNLPKPKDMSDEALLKAIEDLEIEYSKAQQAAELANDLPEGNKDLPF